MIISIEGLYKSYGASVVLQDISAQIDDNSRIGLIGVNGAGKSTLLNIINGELEYEEGIVSRGSNKRFGFLHQDSGLESTGTIHSELHGVFADIYEIEKQMRKLESEIAQTPPETEKYQLLTQKYSDLQIAFESAEGYGINVKIATIINGMGFSSMDMNTPVAVLSGGERTRLAMCKLLLQTPDLLILDEPTNHLDFKTLIWLEEYLQSYKGALLIVSHDRYFLDKLCTGMWEINNHSLNAYRGNYSAYVLQKDEKIERQMHEYEMQQKEIANMKDFIAKNIVRASTTNRAKSRQKALDKMEIVEKPKLPPKPPVIKFTSKRDPVKDVLVIENFGLSVGDGSKKLFDNINLHVRRGEKIAIVGSNGVGKTSFLKAVCGEIPHDSGIIEWGRNTDISYFHQGDDDFDPNKTAINALWDLYPREYEHTIRTILGHVGLTGENVFKKVENLSGGERARLKFANLMMTNGNVIILDEPTNHLDLATKEVIDRALSDFEGTLIVVSHDRYLLNKFPDKIIEMKSDEILEYAGKYNDYLEKKKQTDYEAPAQEDISGGEEEKATANIYHKGKKQRSEEAARKKRLAELEKLIEELEVAIWNLEQDMLLPEVSADYLIMQEKCDAIEQEKTRLDCAINEWSSLAEE